MTPEKGRGSSQKRANALVALSSAAVLTVYAAGYLRTRPAADRIVAESAQRRAEEPAPTNVAGAPPLARVSPGAVSPRAVSPRAAPTSTEVPNAATEPTPAESSTVPPFPASAASQPESPTVPDDEPRIAEPPAASIAARQDEYRDGTYLGWGSCRHGDIQASVVIEGGRIASAAIAQCRTRYSCSWIDKLPGQVVSRQNTNVDYVSGATQSTDAFADAVAEALSKAK